MLISSLMDSEKNIILYYVRNDTLFAYCRSIILIKKVVE